METPAERRGEEPREGEGERERECHERRGPGQLAHTRARGQVGEADRPVDEARPHVPGLERLQEREDVGRRRLQVDLEPGQPRQESDHRDGRGGERRPPRLRVRPQDPSEQSREREDARVVRVDRAARAGGVARPPAGAAVLDRGEQAERGAQHEHDHQRVAPGLGGVVDHEGRERRQRGGHERRPAPHGAHAEQVHERDRQRSGEQRRRAQQLRREVDPCRQPGRDEVQGRRDLRVGMDDRDHVREPAARDDEARRELVGEQRLVRDREPQRHADCGERGDDRHARAP